MARTQGSVSKREKEKKKIEKKKEKEQRKEDRKANAGQNKSLEDMLAYVDENGNLTSTPPDPTKKKTVNVDDIVIGATKIDDQPDVVKTGRVTFFNQSKGYGFIQDDRTKESIFVHITAILEPIQDNDKVTFDTERGPRGMAAVNVKKI